MSGAPQWPLDLLVGELKAMHTLACNEAADRLSALAAVVAAIHTALDQLEADKQRHLDGGPYVGMPAFVSAIAEAVGR